VTTYAHDAFGNRTSTQVADFPAETQTFVGLVNGRRGEALVRVKVRYPDSYSLRVTGPELAERDFVVALHELDPVQEQRRNAAKWRFGLWGALGGIGLCVLVLLGHPEYAREDEEVPHV